MEIIAGKAVSLMVVAIIVALIARRLALPYTVGLVIAGIAIALTRVNTGLVLTHDFVFDVILPPLLFEAAINIHWQELRRDAVPVLVLAILGTIVAAGVVAEGVVLVLGWPPGPALLFGVLMAATDPVAVVAMFKDNKIAGRVRLLVESESLFNDGVAAVLFTLALAWVAAADGPAIAPAAVAQVLLFTVGGGIVAGLACAGAVVVIAGRTSDHLVESTLTTVAAYGSFLVAEHFHCSGVLATVAAGLLTGNLTVLNGEAESQISSTGRQFILDLWEFIAFIANSFVFLLIGLTVAEVSFRRLGLTAFATIIALVLVGRAFTVYPICGVFAWSRWAIPIAAQNVLWWGGLRGALGLALALALPASLPFRGEIIAATFGVVAFSVVLQGLTMPPLLRRAGEASKSTIVH
jgi:CPA1 family monovalent cation:H+ antiporter